MVLLTPAPGSGRAEPWFCPATRLITLPQVPVISLYALTLVILYLHVTSHNLVELPLIHCTFWTRRHLQRENPKDLSGARRGRTASASEAWDTEISSV